MKHSIDTLKFAKKHPKRQAHYTNTMLMGELRPGLNFDKGNLLICLLEFWSFL